ncbi:MAG: dihydrofolate reductase family protein [Bacteroidota bacterium]
MPKIIYYVAISLDGYISGPDGDISRFAMDGAGVEQYQQDLLNFSTTIMGRNTYEFGYQYGLQPGQPAYQHMEHHIFSEHLHLPDPHPQIHVEKLALQRVAAIRDASPTDVYLCGGGQFAGWLLDHGLIDELKLKINPMVLGGGVKLFGDSTTAVSWQLTDQQAYTGGLIIATYQRST